MIIPSRLKPSLDQSEIQKLASESAQRLASSKTKRTREELETDFATVEYFADMIDFFEQIAIQRGLPAQAYEIFERSHYAISQSLIDIEDELSKLDPSLD